MTKDEALKMALEALKRATNYDPVIARAITAIKEALAQPEQKPVAWMSKDADIVYTSIQVDGCFQHDHTPLYTTPPQRTWVGLTDEEWEAMYYKFAKHQEYGAFVSGWDQFARAIEAKLKEKNSNL